MISKKELTDKQKLELIKTIINQYDKQSHNRVAEIQILYDYWDNKKYASVYPKMVKEYLGVDL